MFLNTTLYKQKRKTYAATQDVDFEIFVLKFYFIVSYYFSVTTIIVLGGGSGKRQERSVGGGVCRGGARRV